MKYREDPISQLTNSVVRLECISAKRETSYGSGFFFRFLENDDGWVPAIVTNRHVTKGAVSGVFHITRRASNGTPDFGNYEKIVTNSLQKLIIYHPDPTVDLAVILLGPILSQWAHDPNRFFFVTLNRDNLANTDLLDSLTPMESVVMPGYPNGLWDEKHNMPIIRRGITATHAAVDLNGKPEFLIDAACFPGSSGSPVFLADIGSYTSNMGGLAIGNRLALLGVLYAGPQFTSQGEVIRVVPTSTDFIAISQSMMNLGYVIKAEKILDFEDEIARHETGLVSKKSGSTVASSATRSSPCPCGSGKRFKHCCGSLAS